jgi:hypothetical protein
VRRDLRANSILADAAKQTKTKIGGPTAPQ